MTAGTRRAVGGLTATLSIAGLTWKRILRGRAIWVTLALAAVPAQQCADARFQLTYLEGFDEVDLTRAGRTDRVTDTVNYQKVHARIVELGRGRSHHLLESFASTVLDALLQDFPAVARIVLRVRKETPVLDGIVDAVGVQMSRSRSRKDVS